ncbi:MAG: ABC transporter substrate-binding protein [Actinobacteria bacterium]|nr:ABC transporter substrate-binding protein [Actinomycetota bacterium]
MGKAYKNGLRLAAVASVGALALAACGGGSTSSDASGSAAAAGVTEGTKGGTINALTLSEQWQHVDPQRMYTGVDIAFFTGYTTRTLTQYKYAPGAEGTTIVPDMATDLGTASADAKTWSFTIRDGVSFQDGTPVTCEDIKYGVSRTFATDIITDGPAYAISYLDIPKLEDGTSEYKGPFLAEGSIVAGFDKAVTCSEDNKTITFKLNRPVGDFNYAVTLPAFSPVPKAADTGEKYDDNYVATGPYKIQEYTKGQKMVLVRNENWDPASDDYHLAYPDQIVVSFAIDAAAIDQRLIADAGEDKTAVMVGQLQPENLATIFGTDDPRFKDRSVDGYDPYVRYTVINTQKVPNLKQRIAIAVAINRAEVIAARGGDFAGDIADGVIKPNLAADYAPSGMWTDMFGQAVPDTGDPEFAKKLIAESGEPMPELTYQFPQNPVDEKIAASYQAALAKAGITVKLEPIEPSQYYGIVFDPEKAQALIRSGWAPDWQNASTVIPELFGKTGGFNLGLVDDPAFEAKVQEAAAMTDRAAQGKAWQALNKEAMQNAWVVPTVFGKAQFLWGSNVGNAFLWDPYGSMPYGALFVKSA